MIRAIAIGLCVLFPLGAWAETVRLAVTTSFENSGLADVLLPAIAQDTGLEVQLLVVGTGQALRLGEAGDVDAILVHAKTAEERFVAAGHAPYRREIMYNDFVFIGPEGDPADIATAASASEALVRVAATAADFISRGDDSGTHKAEQALWITAGFTTSDLGPWYKSVGAGMGAALNTSVALEAYVLSDRASWLNFGNKGSQKILFAGDPALFNQYSFLPMSSAVHPHLNSAGAARLESWLTSPAAKALIDGYHIQGQQLFTFNAAP
jgi:tungstate transport system substrate-binding protein